LPTPEIWTKLLFPSKPGKRIFDVRGGENRLVNLKPEAGVDTYLTANEVAVLLKLSLQTIRRYTMNKEIPFHKINRAVRYKQSEIEVWFEKREAAKAKAKNLEGAQQCARTSEGVDEKNVTRRAPDKCNTGKNDEGGGLFTETGGEA
jgi:excisionase family DNA binding protein